MQITFRSPQNPEYSSGNTSSRQVSTVQVLEDRLMSIKRHDPVHNCWSRNQLLLFLWTVLGLGGKVLVRRALELRFPCSRWGRELCHCSPWGPQGSRDPPTAPREPYARVGACPKEAVILWEANAGVHSWKDLCTHRERNSCWNKFSGRACDPAGDPCWSSLFLKDCTPWKGAMLEQLIEIYFHSLI